MSNFNYVDRTNEFSPEDIEKNKVISGVSYLWFLFFLPLVAAPESKFGKFHANQSFLLFILSLAIFLVRLILGFIPVLGRIIGILLTLLNLGVMVFFILGLVFAFQGQAKEIPIIGQIKILNK